MSDQSAPAAQSVSLGRIGVWTSGLTALDVGAVGEAASEIEELGYGAVWSGEAPGARDIYTQALALLGATQRLVVASGIMNIYLRPAGTANAAARTIAALYPGRFIHGVGASHQRLIEGGSASSSASLSRRCGRTSTRWRSPGSMHPRLGHRGRRWWSRRSGRRCSGSRATARRARTRTS